MPPVARRPAVPVLQVPDADLDDLARRLRATRWPEPWPASSPATWSAGIPPQEVRRLADRWLTGYDWRRHERAINALPWAVADIDGLAVHYLLFPADSDAALPIVLTNGWPSSFLELVELARTLSAPSRSGGDPRDALTVVVPCLPGFPPAPQQPALPAAPATHHLWHRLMRDVLGFERYAAHGGDLGAGVTSRLAQEHPQAVAGIHLMAVADPPAYDPESLTVDERAYLAEAATWAADEGGYEHEQQTRPATLSYGLSDSPVGLLAWMAEKYWAWSDRPATTGTLADFVDDDEILTQVSLYWFTNCILTSFRPYFEHRQGMTTEVRRVAVPTAVALFPKDLVHPPRSWVERTYDVVRYTTFQRGGHFAPREATAALASDIAAFCGSLAR